LQIIYGFLKLTLMNSSEMYMEKIEERLKGFDYKYSLPERNFKIHLPFPCYLKVRSGEHSVKMSSHVMIAIPSLPLEFNFLISSLALYLLTWHQWSVLNRGVFVLFGLFIICFVICFIKTETMKAIVHSWIEKKSGN